MSLASRQALLERYDHGVVIDLKRFGKFVKTNAKAQLSKDESYYVLKSSDRKLNRKPYQMVYFPNENDVAIVVDSDDLNIQSDTPMKYLILYTGEKEEVTQDESIQNGRKFVWGPSVAPVANLFDAAREVEIAEKNMTIVKYLDRAQEVAMAHAKLHEAATRVREWDPNKLTVELLVLPPGWKKATDPPAGNIYYIDGNTQTTQWEPPEMLKTLSVENLFLEELRKYNERPQVATVTLSKETKARLSSDGLEFLGYDTRTKKWSRIDAIPDGRTKMEPSHTGIQLLLPGLSDGTEAKAALLIGATYVLYDKTPNKLIVHDDGWISELLECVS